MSTADRSLDQIRQAYKYQKKLSLLASNPDEPTRNELRLLAEMGDICPKCFHDNPGVTPRVLNYLRQLIRVRPLAPACTYDDGAGGGPEHDGGCGCRHLFHSEG